MIFETIIVGSFIGKLMGGKLGNLANLEIKAWFLFALSFILEILALLIVSRTDGVLSEFIVDNYMIINILIYFVLLIGLLFNYKEFGLFITFIGSILNFIPMLFNGGRMPVSIDALKKANLFDQLSMLLEDRIMTHTLVLDDTKFKILTDIIPVSSPDFMAKVISIGDIVIAVGLCILIVNCMKSKYGSEVKTIDFLNPNS